LLVLDDFNKELIFETISCNSEINQSYLNADLGKIMGVRKLRCNVEFEIVVDSNPSISKFD
jgi:hypothetical protein